MGQKHVIDWKHIDPVQYNDAVFTSTGTPVLPSYLYKGYPYGYQIAISYWNDHLCFELICWISFYGVLLVSHDWLQEEAKPLF